MNRSLKKNFSRQVSGESEHVETLNLDTEVASIVRQASNQEARSD